MPEKETKWEIMIGYQSTSKPPMILWGKGKGKELVVSRATIVKLSNQTKGPYMNHNRAMHKDFYK